jgi:hypothetical protein
MLRLPLPPARLNLSKDKGSVQQRKEGGDKPGGQVLCRHAVPAHSLATLPIQAHDLDSFHRPKAAFHCASLAAHEHAEPCAAPVSVSGPGGWLCVAVCGCVLAVCCCVLAVCWLCAAVCCCVLLCAGCVLAVCCCVLAVCWLCAGCVLAVCCCVLLVCWLCSAGVHRSSGCSSCVCCSVAMHVSLSQRGSSLQAGTAAPHVGSAAHPAPAAPCCHQANANHRTIHPTTTAPSILHAASSPPLHTLWNHHIQP